MGDLNEDDVVDLSAHDAELKPEDGGAVGAEEGDAPQGPADVTDNDDDLDNDGDDDGEG